VLEECYESPIAAKGKRKENRKEKEKKRKERKENKTLCPHRTGSNGQDANGL
jgi:hypothetical protein